MLGMPESETLFSRVKWLEPAMKAAPLCDGCGCARFVLQLVPLRWCSALQIAVGWLYGGCHVVLARTLLDACLPLCGAKRFSSVRIAWDAGMRSIVFFPEGPQSSFFLRKGAETIYLHISHLHILHPHCVVGRMPERGKWCSLA